MGLVRAGQRKERRARWVVLASVSGLVLLIAAYGGEAATCPVSNTAWIGLVAIGCAVIATLGMAAAVWAYRETAGEPYRVEAGIEPALGL